MKATGHILMFLLCLAGTLAFYYLGLIWSFADFHPGSDVPVNPELRQRAELGARMTRLFIMPILALVRAEGGGTMLLLVPGLFWILSAMYAGIVHLLLWALITGLRLLPRPEPEPSEPF